MDLFDWTLLILTTCYSASTLGFLLALFLPEIRPRNTSQPFISIVIAARNEARYIQTCLETITTQTYPKDRYEVIVVDDNSEDETALIIQNFSALDATVSCHTVGNRFPEMAAKKRPLSVGIKEARGEIILTTDADCRVPPTWVEGIAKYFQPDTGTVIGFSQIKSKGSAQGFFERLQALDFLVLMTASAASTKLGIPLAATGQNLAYRKSLFEGVGGFSPIADRPSGDDVLLLQLLKNAGKDVVFAEDPSTFVSTWRAETPSGFWQQRRRWASNAFTQLRLNPAFFGYTVIVFLVNLVLPAALAVGIMSGAYGLPLACLSLKIAGDMLVTLKGAKKFDRLDLIGVFPIWELLQAPYIVLVAMASLFTGYTWKGIKHK